MYLAIHCDAKLTVKRLGESYEAHCIVMSSSPAYADGKLLSVQKLLHATGTAQAENTFDVI